MMKKLVGIFIFSIWLSCFFACSHMLSAKTEVADELVSIGWQEVLATGEMSRKDIVSGKYDSYTFFLFPDKRWIENNPKKLKELYNSFLDYGYAIGEKDLAVWFNHKGKPDVQRSFDFAHLFNLDVNSGPYIVYVRPKNPVAKEITVLSSGNFKDTKLALEILKGMAIEEAFDKIIIDFRQLDSDDAISVLNVIKTQIERF